MPKTSDELISEECDTLKALLLEKNVAYGDSALNPIRVFSRADPIEQLRVRIDDKLSRIARADPNALGEDAVLDLLGYLVLFRIAVRRQNEDAQIRRAKPPSIRQRIDVAHDLTIDCLKARGIIRGPGQSGEDSTFANVQFVDDVLEALADVLDLQTPVAPIVPDEEVPR